MKNQLLLQVFLCISFGCLSQSISVTGIVFDKDAVTPMSFSYVANKNSGKAVMTDQEGRFRLAAQIGDTIQFSYIGYGLVKIFTHQYKDSVKNGTVFLKVILRTKAQELPVVTITSNGFSPERMESYAKKLREYELAMEYAANSPITALYYLWSKKGNEIEKLSVLYRQLLLEEMRDHRLPAETVRILAGNDSLNVDEFLDNCFLPEQFLLTASDYELYFAVKQCYRQYLDQRRK